MNRVPAFRVPGDKSITHRALILGALARGDSRIRGALVAGDTESTARVLRALGCGVDALDAGEVRVRGRGLDALQPPAGTLDCGNSGTTARLLLGVLAAQPFRAELSGDASLRSRPMRRVTEPLGRMGARFRELAQADRLPIEVAGGPLQPLDFSSPHASAQVKSALLLAGLCGRVPVRVREPLRSRDHSERMLAALGVPVTVRSDGAGGNDVASSPVEALPPLDVEIPGDISAAAFLLGAGLLLGRELVIENVGVNPTRTGVLDVLARMGAPVAAVHARDAAGEPSAELWLRPAPLSAVRIEAAEVPALVDEIPLLAVLAARAAGESRITGAGELRVKESDRIALTVANLRALGADAEELPDGLVVRGGTRPLRGRVATGHDHRIAMAFGVLGAVPGNDIIIDHPESAAVSDPEFWTRLEALKQA